MIQGIQQNQNRNDAWDKARKNQDKLQNKSESSASQAPQDSDDKAGSVGAAEQAANGAGLKAQDTTQLSSEAVSGVQDTDTNNQSGDSRVNFKAWDNAGGASSSDSGGDDTSAGSVGAAEAGKSVGASQQPQQVNDPSQPDTVQAAGGAVQAKLQEKRAA